MLTTIPPATYTHPPIVKTVATYTMATTLLSIQKHCSSVVTPSQEDELSEFYWTIIGLIRKQTIKVK